MHAIAEENQKTDGYSGVSRELWPINIFGIFLPIHFLGIWTDGRNYRIDIEKICPLQLKKYLQLSWLFWFPKKCSIDVGVLQLLSGQQCKDLSIQ